MSDSTTPQNNPAMQSLLDRIWQDVCRYQYQYIYTCHNLGWQKKLRKGIKITSLLFSTGGILGWSIWKEPGFIVVSYIISSLIQLVSLIENNIILSDESFEKLLDLQIKIKEHFDRLEKLYYDCDLGHIKDDKKVSKTLLIEFKKFENEIKKLDASLNSWEPKFLKGKADPDYDNFINLKTRQL